MKKEIWKTVEGYNDYIVSSNGRVARILKGDDNGKGYRFIKFPDGKRIYIHQLIARAFISNPNNYPIINHKDGVKNNNNSNNLEWCNNSHNIKEAYRIGLHQPKYVKVVQKDLQGNVIKVWNSMKEIQEVLNIDYQRISKCCRGVRKTCKHYIWEYYDKKEGK